MAAGGMGEIMLRSADQFLFDVIVKSFTSSARTEFILCPIIGALLEMDNLNLTKTRIQISAKEQIISDRPWP